MTQKTKMLSTSQKAAILLLSLGEDLAAEIIRTLPERDAKRILEQVSSLKRVDEDLITEIQSEFFELLTSTRGQTLAAGPQVTRQLLAKAFGMDHAFGSISDLVTVDLRAFESASHVDSKLLFQILRKELPQTIALILAHMDPKKSGETLKHFDEVVRTEILLRMATLGEVDQGVLEEVHDTFADALDKLRKQSVATIGGVEKTAAVFAAMGANQRETMLQQLELTQPDVAAAVRAKLWTFEDFRKISTKDIEKLLRKVKAGDLELALKNASDEMRKHFFQAMSQGRSSQLMDDLSVGAKVSVSKIEEAQKRLADLAASMIKLGEISDPNDPVA